MSDRQKFGRNLAMLTFANPSVIPSVAARIGALAAPLSPFFTPNSSKPRAQDGGVASTAGARDQSGAGTVLSKSPSSPPVARLDGRVAFAPAVDNDARGGTYWPCERLNAFILRMAAHGHCVSAAMMLGHRPYAVQRLAAAQQVPDEALRELAAELHAYFDAPRGNP
jgi:hypothetical protein